MKSYRDRAPRAIDIYECPSQSTDWRVAFDDEFDPHEKKQIQTWAELHTGGCRIGVYSVQFTNEADAILCMVAFA